MGRGRRRMAFSTACVLGSVFLFSGQARATGLDLEASRPMHCQTASPFHLTNAYVVRNNLGGLGPDSGEEVIEYENVGTGRNGNPISLVISNSSRYSVGSQQDLAHKQGLHGAFGRIAVAAGTTVKLRFRFVDTFKRKTIVPDNMILTIFDLGKKEDSPAQSMAACGASGYFLSDSAKPPVETTVHVLEDRPQLFCTTFQSSSKGGETGDPVGPDVLTDAQKARSVSLHFIQEASIELTLSAGGAKDGRHGTYFLFAGKSTVDNCIAAGTTTTSTLTTSTHTTVTTQTTTVTTITDTSTTPTSTTRTTSTHTITSVTTATTTTRTASSTVTTTATTPTTSTILPTQTTTTTQATTITTQTRTLPITTTTLAMTEPPTTATTTNTPSRMDSDTTTRESASDGGSSEFWNCLSGDMSQWGQDKRSFCCSRESIGCDHVAPVNPEHLFDCKADAAAWTTGWSHAKKAWCCKHKQVGCHEPAGTSTAPSASAQGYDCEVGKTQWETNWSAEQQYYCCTRTGVSCRAFSSTSPSAPPTTQAPAFTILPLYTAPPLPTLAPLPTLPPLPTLAPLPTIPLWVPKGELDSTTVVDTDSFDCKAGLSNWRDDWSQAKKDWCCVRESLGCFDCQAGQDNADLGWSTSKRNWCCTHEHLGCPFDCTQQDAAWSAEQSAWCCKTTGAGCLQDYQQKFDFLRGSSAAHSALPAWSVPAWTAVGAGFLTSLVMLGVWSRYHRSSNYRAVRLDSSPGGLLSSSE